jgi:hypothetical protein
MRAGRTLAGTQARSEANLKRSRGPRPWPHPGCDSRVAQRPRPTPILSSPQPTPGLASSRTPAVIRPGSGPGPPGHSCWWVSVNNCFCARTAAAVRSPVRSIKFGIGLCTFLYPFEASVPPCFPRLADLTDSKAINMFPVGIHVCIGKILLTVHTWDTKQAAQLGS